MESVFPEARKILADADPEVAALVQEEKRRQWCGPNLLRVCIVPVCQLCSLLNCRHRTRKVLPVYSYACASARDFERSERALYDLLPLASRSP
jgi:hypothetical protein